jgi:Meckel syndrome type 1 protein
VLAGGASAAAAPGVQDATFGGRALLVPEGHGVTFGGPADGSATGALGGSAAGSAGSAAAVGIVGSDDQVSLAAGSRGTIADDAVPASIVGEHDVAPD